MKNYVIVLFLFVAVALCGQSTIEWGNLQWPMSTQVLINTDSENIYGQVYKSGVTDSAGQGAGLTAELGYGDLDSDPATDDSWVWHAANYNTDVGNNDEYVSVFNIATEGQYTFTYRYKLESEPDYYYASERGVVTVNDEAPTDVNVTFKVNMNYVDAISTDGVHIAGNFQSWSPGSDAMSDDDLDGIYDFTTQITTGYVVEYKFINGNTWDGAESLGNRSFTVLDEDMVLDVVNFNNYNPSDYLEFDTMVAFMVDVSDSLNAGAQFNTLSICGDQDPLDWDFSSNNNPLTNQGNNIWRATITFAAGTYRHLNFKFARNSNDWEAGFEQNHYVELRYQPSGMVVNVEYGNMGAVPANNASSVKPKLAISNYPNPFNPSTCINLTFEKPQKAEVSIYNIKGQKIKTFANRHFKAGLNQINWNGTNNYNNTVSSGLYFVKVKAGKTNLTHKLMLIK